MNHGIDARACDAARIEIGNVQGYGLGDGAEFFV